MSHQVLARKWRPQTFEDIVGQEHVVTALANALNADRLHHAYLFSGTRGVGKTTVARVLAKALSCQSGISAHPCGECDACVAIKENRFVDLIEVDAASRTRVEDTRELLENIQYAPTQGRFKIYLIDEVHMLSGHSFNALLKTLEEPPEHVKFLLATTDPQKLPITVLSRCLQFTLRHISQDAITKQITKVLNAEQFSFDEPCVEQLADSADGSMRDALSLLDQAIAYSGGELNEGNVNQMLGTVPSQQLDGLVRAICGQDSTLAITTIQTLASLNVEFGKLLDQLSAIFHAGAISQVVPEYLEHVGRYQQTIEYVQQEVPAEDLQLLYQIAITSRKELYLAHSAKSGFEMAVLRMLMFRPGDDDAPLREKRVATKPVTEARPKLAPEVRTEASSKVRAEIKSEISQEKSLAPDGKAITQSVEQGFEQPLNEAPAAVFESEPVSAIEKPDDIKPKADQHQWQQLIQGLSLNGMALALANHCSCIEQTEGVVRLALQQDHESLMSTKAVEKLNAALDTHFGAGLKLTIELQESDVASPAQQKKNQESAEQLTAETNLSADPFVQALQENLQAEIIPQSIKSIDKEEEE
jgi:DNA polymerase-3 subunit gamma/tau